MSIKVVKQTLKNENELLDGMIAFIKEYPDKGFTDQAQFIRKSWIRFLTDRRRTNAAQQKASAAKLKKDFLLEITQLGAYIHVTDDKPGYTEQWKAFLECERDISAYLYDKVKK